MTETATFGARLEGVAYVDRPAAYAVVAGENGTVAAVKGTSGKFFLPGGGCLPGETAEETVKREVREELARNFPPILKNTPPLYDFLTQIAAFDSPIASFLDEEMRTFKNFPMTCQSLQSVAQFLKFDWNTPHKFRDVFKARLFDNLGRLDIDGVSEWYTRRSRFSSSVPLEYAYAAWAQLPTPGAGKGDEFADFRGVSKDLLTAFQPNAGC